MKLKIKLLRPFSNAVGKSELELDFDGMTLENLLKVLIDKYQGVLYGGVGGRALIL